MPKLSFKGYADNKSVRRKSMAGPKEVADYREVRVSYADKDIIAVNNLYTGIKKFLFLILCNSKECDNIMHCVRQ